MYWNHSAASVSTSQKVSSAVLQQWSPLTPCIHCQLTLRHANFLEYRFIAPARETFASTPQVKPPKPEKRWREDNNVKLIYMYCLLGVAGACCHPQRERSPRHRHEYRCPSPTRAVDRPQLQVANVDPYLSFPTAVWSDRRTLLMAFLGSLAYTHLAGYRGPFTA